jgi:hypothetical protein
MSFIDQDTLKAFASDQGFLIKEVDLPGLSEAIAQSDEIIFQKTGVAIPAAPANANAKLRNIACALVVWFTSGMQGKLDEFELSRRKKLYDDAMAELNKIQDGSSPLLDSSGAIISSLPATYFSSTQRLTEPL